METSTSIRAIDKTTVNKICSGQVVLSLSTAVKELIENSLDAGANSIQIKLVEYGSNSIEVIDNGCGVEEVNYQALTLKHYTSKISDFSDLNSVQTFGFRGEALSSLCALSEVTIVTQHEKAALGATLKFDHNGIIKSSLKTFRKVGTTVKLENLFCTLPIRRSEFLKNLKREFGRMCNVLYAYGLISTGVRITCKNQISKSKVTNIETQKDKKEITVIDSKGESIENNIISIFGVKQKQNLLKVSEKCPSQNLLGEFGLENTKIDFSMFKLEGYISSCIHGCGRNASDRQFYYINSRPIDNLKISKLINDVYHQFNNQQDPFVILNIKINTDSIDLNVTPDKRQILIQNEVTLLAILKQSLLDIFQSQPSVFRLQNSELKISLQDKNSIKSYSELNLIRQKGLNNIEMEKPQNSNIVGNTSNEDYKPDSNKSGVPFPLVENEKKNPIAPSVNFKKSDENISNILHKNIDSSIIDQKIESESCKTHNRLLENIKGKTTEDKISRIYNKCDFKRKFSFNNLNSYVKVDPIDVPIESKRMKIDLGLSQEIKLKRNSREISISLTEIKNIMSKEINYDRESQNPDVNDFKFLAEIKPQNNKRAESELSTTITKESFRNMKIIGQFNLGFIITKLGSDIFIIDQHATDEKYNFEKLKSNTILQNQVMINPETLELTVDKEELMLQHRQVFLKNGFDFIFDEKEVPMRRIKLTRVPISKNIVFGKDDIDEMLFLLEDAPENVMVRPTRLEAMFASRACRKSVMVGTPLNHQEMRKLVDHMGEIEHPWNCPHGRPTMRHLVNLKLICLNVNRLSHGT